MDDCVITKESLDAIYNETFDFEKFKSVDPCGIVYELLAHTDDQLDIELGALFVAMISWGNRKAIRKAARNMLENEMSWHPARFVVSGVFEESYLEAKNKCVYRTLNVDKFREVCRNLQSALLSLGENPTIEKLLLGKTCEESIAILCKLLSPAKLGTPYKSACKRICMYMRWMTRSGAPDFGIWHERSSQDLYAVMDVHVCTLTQSLLGHKQASWKSCVELTDVFRNWNPQDPLQYDVALMTLADAIDSQKAIPSADNSL